MKKLLVILFLLSRLLYANLVNDGIQAYNNGNYKKAFKLLKKSAEQGNATAQLNLGIMYAKGQGVRQNMTLVKELFGKACDNGLESGCDGYRTLNEAGY
jgi:TPR repeat protein